MRVAAASCQTGPDMRPAQWEILQSSKPQLFFDHKNKPKDQSRKFIQVTLLSRIWFYIEVLNYRVGNIEFLGKETYNS